MIKEVTPKERRQAIEQRKRSGYYGHARRGGRTFLRFQGRWYETTGCSLREIVEFQQTERRKQAELEEAQLSLFEAS